MPADIGAKIGIEGEASYRKQLQQITAQSKALASEMKVVESEFKAEATAQEKAAAKAQVLSKQVEVQKDKVKLLADQLAKTKDKYGENSTQALELQNKLNLATVALNKMESELGESQKAADGYGEEVGEATKGTQEFDAAALALSKQQLAEFWGKAAQGVKKVADAMTTSAKELDKGYDTIVKKTGATGDQLQDLKRIANDVYGSMAVDMEDVGSAVGEIATRFKASGDTLKDMSREFLQFANINGTNVADSVDQVDRLMKIYKVDTEDTTNVMGLLTKASQDTGIQTSQLMNTLDANGAALQELGFDIISATSLLSTFEANGVDTAGVMTALKKSVQNAAKQGKDANTVLAEAEESIKNAATETEALQIASEVFGTRGAVVMAQGIRDGRISLDKATDSIKKYGDVVSRTYEETLSPWDKTKIAMNNLKTVGSELAGQALATLVPAIEKVTDVVRSVSEWFQNLSPTAQKLVGIVTALGAGTALLAPKIMSVIQTMSMLKTASLLSASAQAAQAAATTGQAAATGAATVAQKGLNAAMWANPVVWLVAGIAALTAGLAIYAKNANWAGKEMVDLNKELETTNSAYEAQKQTVADDREEVERLSKRVSDLQKKEALSVDEKMEMVGAVKRLNDLMPELNLNLDEESGKLIDQTGAILENTDALDANFEAAMRRYELEHNEEWKAAALDNYNQNLAARNEAEEEYNRLKAEQAALDANDHTAANTAKFLELQNAIAAASEAMKTASDGMETAKADYEGLVETAGELGEAETAVTEAVEASTMANEANIPAWNELTETQKTTAEKVSQAYKDMKDAVTDSIRSQMSMFEEFDGGAEVTTDKLLENMQSQIDGVTNWEENLTTLANRGINQGLLQYLLEAGPKGANYVQAFVNMTSDEFAEANRLWEESVDIQGFTNDIGQQLDKGLADVASSMDDTGLNIGLGLAKGITNAKQAVIAAAKDMARSTRATVENELAIASPSKVFRYLGEMTGEGFAIGLEDTMPQLSNVLSPWNDVGTFSGRGVNSIDPDEIYSAVRNGAENAQTRIMIGSKEFGRLLRGMGVVMA